jgi:dihydrofolate reductase
MSLTQSISIIAAVAGNRVIGRGGSLPWHLPDDLKHFRQITLGHAVIMGRKTFESIGKPLPGRSNVVVTRSREWNCPGCRTAASLEAAMEALAPAETAFVIGGAEIYALALPMAGRLCLTEIERDFAGDAFFPGFNHSEWREVSREQRVLEGSDGFPYAFVEYRRHP